MHLHRNFLIFKKRTHQIFIVRCKTLGDAHGESSCVCVCVCAAWNGFPCLTELWRRAAEWLAADKAPYRSPYLPSKSQYVTPQLVLPVPCDPGALCFLQELLSALMIPAADCILSARQLILKTSIFLIIKHSALQNVAEICISARVALKKGWSICIQTG